MAPAEGRAVAAGTTAGQAAGAGAVRVAGGEARPPEEETRAAQGQPASARETAAAPPPAGLDWPGLMRAGLRGLGLRPAEFWDMTPAELALMLGIEFGAGAMTRSRLGDLMARFPDPAPQAGTAAGFAMRPMDD